MAITKPPVLPAWADTAANPADIVQPTNGEISAGWPSSTTPPSRQRFNWILNFCANAVRYFSRRGLVDYDAAETYSAGDIVRGDDFLIYHSAQSANTGHTPSTSPTWWVTPAVKTVAVDNNTTSIATTAYVIGQISSTVPVMDGGGAIGVSLKFARADHVHPSDSSKANTSGSYGGLSVGFASSAGAVPFSGVTGKPTTTGGYGITDAITTATIGSQSVAFATNASRAYPRRWDGAAIEFVWSGQPGQPTWLLGGTDGVNFYVYNPANFSVNYATSAGAAATAGFATSAGSATTANTANSATSASQSTTQPAGTSNTSIATTAFANPGASLSSSGYARLPSGLILQWGFASTGFTSFPIAFPNACVSAHCSTNRQFAGSGGYNHVSNLSASSAYFLFDPSPNSGYWFAIGY